MDHRLKRWQHGVRARLGSRSDTGTTLVEMLVALLIIAIVVAPLAVLFGNSLNSASANSGRQNAAVLATSIESNLEGASYSNVGFTQSAISGAGTSYATASGTGYTWNPDADGVTTSQSLVEVSTQPSFTVGSSQTTFAPVMTVTSGGTSYTVTTHVLSVAGQVEACPNYSSTTSNLGSYDRVFVYVAWQDGGMHNSLEEDEVIYPGDLSGQTSDESGPTPPGNITATPSTTTAGEVTVTWSLPANWNPSSSTEECFAIGYANSSQVQGSTGMLNDNLWPAGSTTASYTVSGLTQGGSGQEEVFYVIAYSAYGTASTESTDSATTAAPSGPVITAISDGGNAYGSAGDTLTVSGYFLTTGMNAAFCAFTVTGCVKSSSWTTCPTTGYLCTTLSSCTTTSGVSSCTVIIPAALSTLSSSLATGVYYFEAESSADITSAPLSGDQFTYQPSMTAVSTSSGVSTVLGTNLFPGTFFSFGGIQAAGTAVSCSSTGTSCTITVPSGWSGSGKLTADDNNVTATITTSY